MCGIVGYIGKREAIPVLMKGLEHLEYRGYDSAGVACVEAGTPKFLVVKEQGKLSRLKERLNGFDRSSHLGIGHTRWATHGAPSRENAHPHLGGAGRVALVHNGILENHDRLRSKLLAKRYQFKSQTDTEVAAHLIDSCYRGHFTDAIKQAVKQMDGFFAFVAMSREHPDRLYALKRSNPLVIGVGENEHFVASDISALLPYTKKVIYLEDDELAVITRKGVQINRLRDGRAVRKRVSEVTWTLEQAKKGGFPHFMLKEIHEQPEVLEVILRKRVGSRGVIHFDTLGPKIDSRLKRARKIYIVSCGTAYHAGLVGDYMIEWHSGIPTEAHVSSEFRYSAQIIGRDDVALFITQSGETADTLAALRQAKKKKALTIAVVNVIGSTIAREADAVIYTHAGPEIGVASTKAYLAQLMTLALFSFHLGVLRKKITSKRLKQLIQEAKKLPQQTCHILEHSRVIDKAAEALRAKRNFIYLGRGYNFPTALEGALKLKEITYAHAHGYAAGEMKHGPIALIDEHQPVICIVPESETYAKMISNVEEIHARSGIVISIVTEGDSAIEKLSRWAFQIPRTEEVFSPILAVVPLQLLAYQVAVLNGRDVDQPRNLAKSVTVE